MTDRPVAARCWRRLPAGLALATAGMAWAQGAPPEAGGQASIYTCVAPDGRRITSDRPIAECMGSGQRELTPGGGLRRIVPPVLTASERAREAERLRREAEGQARLDEEKRRNHALVTRYPDQAAHDQARRDAVAQIDDQIGVVRQRLGKLERQQQEIKAELEFYRHDPGRAPARLGKLAEENARQQQAQTAYLGEQLRERERLIRTFDDELARLQRLWQQETR